LGCAAQRVDGRRDTTGIVSVHSSAAITISVVRSKCRDMPLLRISK
jgi:hypothetical protein